MSTCTWMLIILLCLPYIKIYLVLVKTPSDCIIWSTLKFIWCHLCALTTTVVVLVLTLNWKVLQVMPSGGVLAKNREILLFKIIYMYTPNWKSVKLPFNMYYVFCSADLRCMSWVDNRHPPQFIHSFMDWSLTHWIACFPCVSRDCTKGGGKWQVGYNHLLLVLAHLGVSAAPNFYCPSETITAANPII